MYADDLRDQLLEFNVNALHACVYCDNNFLVKDHPDMICPKCGMMPTEEECIKIIDLIPVMIATRNALMNTVEEDPEEIEDEPERCDPPGLDDVIGNAQAVRQINMALDAYKGRQTLKEDKEPIFPHLILTGSGGTGKTMLAEIIAREIGKPIRLQMGQSLINPSRVGDVLLSLKPFDVLFIDEIHGLKPACQETLYRALEDRLYVKISKAGTEITTPVKLPPFTLIGATTDEFSILPSMLQRFKYRIRLERLKIPELSTAIAQRAEQKGWHLDYDSSIMVAQRSHGTPRLAVQLLDGCIDTAIASGRNDIEADIVKKTCEVWDLDDLGLDVIMRRYLMVLKEAKGEPVKLNVIASRLDGLARRTVETKIESELVWLGLIVKAKTGRILTEKGIKHMGKKLTTVR